MCAISQNTVLIYNESLSVPVEIPKILSVQLAPLAIRSVRSTLATQILCMSNLRATSMTIAEVLNYDNIFLSSIKIIFY